MGVHIRYVGESGGIVGLLDRPSTVWDTAGEELWDIRYVDSSTVSLDIHKQ